MCGTVCAKQDIIIECVTFYNNYKYDIIEVYLEGDYMGKKKKTEYICKCHKITKSDMKKHIKDGISDFKSLQKENKIGNKCSSCKKKNKKRFEKQFTKFQNKQVSPVH